MPLKNWFVSALLIAALNLLATGRATGQTFTNLHNFLPFTSVDGGSPGGGLVLAGNALYGTTASGGSNYRGTVFKVNLDGTGYAVLYSFSQAVMDGDYTDYGAPTVVTNADGYRPNGGLAFADGLLFGTTQYGGTSGYGTVFAINTNGTGFTVLHTFSTPATYPINSDGVTPNAGVIFTNGTLYGTTLQGGTAGYGTVFEMSTNGSGYTVLHNFDNVSYNPVNYSYSNQYGTEPQSHLALSGSTLFGTTSLGGSLGGGTVFSLDTNGNNFADLHDFSNYVDGSRPNALTVSSNLLYGTCPQGGSYGAGTLFSLATSGANFTTLCSFGYGGGAASPDADLVLASNVLYGATQSDGADYAGTIFDLNTDGTGFNVLYTFSRADFMANSNIDGTYPNGLLLAGNFLCGTANGGGASGNGTVFSLNLAAITNSQPPLGINLSGGDIVVSWPDNAGAYTLQSTTNLNPPIVWVNVPTIPVLINGQNVVTNVMNGILTFYRLFP